ncbi:MAG: hypothetical protein ACJ72G_12010 [Friedmanniella sp.]
MNGGALWIPWFRVRSWQPGRRQVRAQSMPRPPALVVCPHCTNIDTLTRHCPDDRCGWALCTCGALIYTSRRHRHPSHRSALDTCHDPKAAA